MALFKLLVLTDHSTHSKENSIYSLLGELRKDPRCKYIDVASRSLPENSNFFHYPIATDLWASRVNSNFKWSPGGVAYYQNKRLVKLLDYDYIFIRLPHPVFDKFWEQLVWFYPEDRIINRPSGIRKTGSKAFLLNFPELCPPMQLCQDLESVEQFRKKFPIILKPLSSYGGKGIIRIEENRVWDGGTITSFSVWVEGMDTSRFPFLGMQYLEGVRAGDKRIVVVNGHIIGASLRMPADNSWLCNASQGGASKPALLTDEEMIMVETVTPVLQREGVLFFGLDTLEDHKGIRHLSEINTLSIGGLKQINEQSSTPVLPFLSKVFWNYLEDISPQRNSDPGAYQALN